MVDAMDVMELLAEAHAGNMEARNQCDLLEYLSQRAVISEVFCDGVG